MHFKFQTKIKNICCNFSGAKLFYYKIRSIFCDAQLFILKKKKYQN